MPHTFSFDRQCHIRSALIILARCVLRAEIELLTSRRFPAIKVDVMEIRSMASRLLRDGQRNSTTAIARMLGKAVKLRHCPATVSAPAPMPRRLGHWVKAGFQPGFFRPSRRARGNHWRRAAEACLWEGGWRRRKSGDRSSAPLTRLRSEGNEGAIMPVSSLIRAHSPERAFAYSLPLSSSALLSPAVPGCVDPRRGHRHVRRQGHRRQCGLC